MTSPLRFRGNQNPNHPSEASPDTDVWFILLLFHIRVTTSSSRSRPFLEKLAALAYAS